MQEQYRVFPVILSAAALALAWGSLARAQVSENSPAGDVFIEGQLCLSDDDDCGPAEAFVDFTEIKIKDSIPGLYFENTTGNPGDETDWQIKTDQDQFRLIDRGASGAGTNEVFNITAGAPEDALTILSNGNVGMGTSTPAFPLHIVRAAGTSIGDNVGFRLENSSAGSSWVFTGVEGNTDHFIINKLGSGTQEMRLNEGGNMMIPGTLTTGGPTCSGGCDEVFQPGGAVESIEDHAASMWEQSHLPGVGLTEPGRPMNLSEKVGGLINELEKAHIYIERLHEQGKEKDKRIRELEDRNTEVVRRLSHLEALLGVAPASN